MSAKPPLIIVGSGLAGYTLARDWRKRDRSGALILVTTGDGSFYSKPMLSNALAQAKTPDALVTKTAAQMAAELDADILTATRVRAIDTQVSVLDTDRGRLAYGNLVLALGAEPIRLPVQGAGADDMLSINGLEDYRHFRQRLTRARSVAIIGPGLIGCEFANDLASQSLDVDVIGPDPWPISALLPDAAGRALQAALAGAGVRFHLGATAARIERLGDACRLTLSNGAVIEPDLVLSAVGLRPATALAQAAGLQTQRGIAVDRRLQTSDPHVFALGDCAEVAGLNLPYVIPLMHGARALAKTLAGEPTEVVYPPMPVVIKTPALAAVAAPPPRGVTGDWIIEGGGSDIRARYLSPHGGLLGFALTGTATAEKQALTKALPRVL